VDFFLADSVILEKCNTPGEHQFQNNCSGSFRNAINCRDGMSFLWRTAPPRLMLMKTGSSSRGDKFFFICSHVFAQELFESDSQAFGSAGMKKRLQAVRAGWVMMIPS
jgi:hypothetical protein